LLEERVEDGHSEQDSRSAADRTHEVCEDTESADADTTECSAVMMYLPMYLIIASLL
jgi:hypothetical protein